MKTRHLVSLVTGVLILSALLPVGLSVWLAHRQVEQKFDDELDMFSSRVILRTQKVVTQAKDALQTAQAFKGVPCSNAHLQLLRQLSYSYRYVQEVIYQENDVPLCSSLKENSRAAAFPAPQHIDADGYRGWLTKHNDVGIQRNMAVLGKGHYIVMVDPASFIDVIPSGLSPIGAAVIGAAHGVVVSSSEPLDPAVMPLIRQNKVQSIERHNVIYHIQPFRELGLSIVTWSYSLTLRESWQRQALIWLPVGIVAGLLAAAFVLRILRRLQSPRSRLQDAITNREIRVHYQPIISLETGKIVGAEALARWPQPDGSYLSPDTFIPLAEQTRLTMPLTLLIIDTVFDELGKWLQRHPTQHISINLAPADLGSNVLIERLKQHLDRWQLKPAQIALELTERGFANPKTSVPLIARFRQAGYALYIDDFGTGYSSLSYLQNLDIDVLKIDKSFVDALEYKNVTTHIIEMARALQLKTVAEGIETLKQENWLKQHGVQYGQGWLYSKALPKAEFVLWANDNLKH